MDKTVSFWSQPDPDVHNQEHGTGRIGLAVAAMIGAFVGIIAGLLVGSITSDSLEAMRADRDLLAESYKQMTARAEMSEGDLLTANDGIERLQQQLQDARTEVVNATKTSERMCEYYIQSQALIHMMQESPSIVQITRAEAFRANFNEDWFCPELWFRAVGGKWFSNQLIHSGVLTQQQLDALLTAEVGSGSGHRAGEQVP